MRVQSGLRAGYEIRFVEVQTFMVPEASGVFGLLLSAMGDVDRNGRADLVIGHRLAAGGGEVYVRDGTSAPLTRHDSGVEAPTSGFGASVTTGQ